MPARQGTEGTEATDFTRRNEGTENTLLKPKNLRFSAPPCEIRCLRNLRDLYRAARVAVKEPPLPPVMVPLMVLPSTRPVYLAPATEKLISSPRRRPSAIVFDPSDPVSI